MRTYQTYLDARLLGPGIVESTRCRLYGIDDLIVIGAGLALSAAGSGMGMAGQAQSKAAEESAQAAELARQQGYQKQASEIASTSIAGSTADVAAQQMAKGAQTREAGYSAVQGSLPGAGSVALPGQNTVVGGGSASPTGLANAAATKSASAWSKATGTARAKLGGYEDWDTQQSVKNLKAQEDLGVVSNIARGSASVLPVEMEAASHAGDALSGWGSLVSALGAVTGMAGAVGGFGAASSAATSANTLAVPESAMGGFVPVSGSGAALDAAATAAAPYNYNAWSGAGLWGASGL